jgi:hypothetical protein
LLGMLCVQDNQMSFAVYPTTFCGTSTCSLTQTLDKWNFQALGPWDEEGLFVHCEITSCMLFSEL